MKKTFEELRFDKRFHLGEGDIRLTIAMQEEIEEELNMYKGLYEDVLGLYKDVLREKNLYRLVTGGMTPKELSEWIAEVFTHLNKLVKAP